MAWILPISRYINLSLLYAILVCAMHISWTYLCSHLWPTFLLKSKVLIHGGSLMVRVAYHVKMKQKSSIIFTPYLLQLKLFVGQFHMRLWKKTFINLDAFVNILSYNFPIIKTFLVMILPPFVFYNVSIFAHMCAHQTWVLSYNKRDLAMPKWHSLHCFLSMIHMILQSGKYTDTNFSDSG